MALMISMKAPSKGYLMLFIPKFPKKRHIPGMWNNCPHPHNIIVWQRFCEPCWTKNCILYVHLGLWELRCAPPSEHKIPKRIPNLSLWPKIWVSSDYSLYQTLLTVRSVHSTTPWIMLCCTSVWVHPVNHITTISGLYSCWIHKEVVTFSHLIKLCLTNGS